MSLLDTTPFLLIAFLTASLQAGEADIVTRLEGLGAKITRRENVVAEVAFTDCSKVGEPEIKAIGELTTLKSLTLYGKCRSLDDATVKHLTGLKSLEALHTEGAMISDAGLDTLTAFQNLRSLSFFHLSLDNKAFTGAGFVSLKNCPKLERLTVAGILMGDEGFAAISQITQLRELRTWHTYQTQAANSLIARLPHLTTLQMGQRLPRATAKELSFNDDSLGIFATIQTLQTLHIGEANFTLEGLRVLKKLPHLKSLVLHDTEMPATEVDKLRPEMPGVKIELQPLTEDQRVRLQKYIAP